MNKIQHFNIETSVNDKRNIKGFELDNKIKIIFISDPDINISSCSIAVGAGYLHDTYPGTAHFLEHLLFMGSEKYPEQNDYHSYIQINGGQDNAFTADNMTCYYLALESSFLKKGIEMLSWFFRAPLLNETHIKSEMEIIDSEHNKNILSDNWIVDDIFKNFIKSDSKYKKFGTGNLKSLGNITKKDIYNFYEQYYTTDNLYVCIVDSKNIEQMINDYIYFFQAIPIKLSDPNSDRFQKNNLELIDNNLIFYSSSSDYLITNHYLIFDVIETNLIDCQLIHFINYLIGTEYINSLAYYLKENNIIKEISSSIEYFFDFSAAITIQLIMINDDKNNIIKSYLLILELLNQIKNISDNEFIEIYNNYRKIKTLKLLYDSTTDSVFISNYVVENMIKGNISEAIIRNYKVPEFSEQIFNKFKEIVQKIIIKTSTNINFKNIPKNNFINSTWYSSTYYIDNFIFDSNSDTHENNLKSIVGVKFNFLNLIGIKNFLIKTDTLNIMYDKSIVPKLIYESNKLSRKVYLMECNKYNKPIGSISVIRKNKLLFDKYNKILIGIYEEICNRVLNYYLETIGTYKLSFNMSVHRDFLIYNFIGIDYELNFFVSQIIKQIYPDIILYNNDKSKKYFNDIIRDIKEYIINYKYNTPYTICSKYLSYLLDNNLLPEEKLNFIKQLSWEDFVIKITDCLKYSDEYYLLTGIKKYGYQIDILSSDYYDFEEDQYIKDIIYTLELNPKKYLVSNKIIEEIFTNLNQKNLNSIESIEKNKTILKKYKINSFDTNPNEINNCLIKYWFCGENINLIYNDSINKNIIDIKVTKKIIKTKLIMEFVSEIINEPLFDKIRTIDKLGYIVKADSKIIYSLDNSLYFIILYLVQSSYSVDRISESIINFNKFIIKDIKNNYDEYFEKFRLLKESKLIEFNKPFSNLAEEISSYIESIISKNFIFNVNSLYKEVCSEINFSDDVQPIIYHIVKNKSDDYNIIIDKKID